MNYDYTLTDTLKMAVGSQIVFEKENSRKCEENKLCMMITR
ncbi:hypothetical protein AAAY30_08835 [Ruminococcoides bili]